LHRHSPRAHSPFIALNMAAIPKDLMESELFGHEKGAFTGAANQRRGRFEQADGGTLSLDELGDMPAETQTRPLRVLADRALHRHSPRAHSPFIALNMAAIPKDLMESELFGHEKGAFTGAANQRRGRFEQADGGTLFLDEIGDMPAETQTRLLRVLADGEFYRVGGHTPVKVDVRIIAATHQNLENLVQGGRFREDLFHRLNVIRIHIPRLSDRREDIPALARHFLAKAAKE